MNNKIAIIGGGNLGTAIAEGLINSGFSKPEHILITKRNVKTLHALEQKGVLVGDDNVEAVRFANLVILAVKPFQVNDVLGKLKEALDPAKHVLISVVTGITIEQLLKAAGKKVPVIRAMPNTAIAIQESMTCLAAHEVNKEQVSYTEDLFNQLGRVVWIDEKLMDAATVLGACGTAYAMRYIRANIQGGIEIGFDAATATLIAAQTVKGAAELLLKKGTHPEQEIDKVTTPKGCTIAGLNEMEHQGFSSSLIKGIVASYDKIAKD
ncbi:pyrroline-5-carboxylate reductase [Paraflavitalea soli]|uniref:Pyrroline-5-carboxylate reductase n=1 Tax=Paraflavitalea soli TaxID=2315862 RepID=A0A3B7MN52_9BACT|nr:pyrroline-5-carboxylate reductase [Paraflavitalea soli]AXY75167.1 pyrroline-5-carboxylate reductase [Paraflavitalea soli]